MKLFKKEAQKKVELSAEEKAFIDAGYAEIRKENLKAFGRDALIGAAVAAAAVAVYKIVETRDGARTGGCDTQPTTPTDADAAALCREYGMSDLNPGSYF